ncbi:MAG: CCA tRNA nucleotidyltransferase [Flavobacteriaceae bacterium]
MIRNNYRKALINPVFSTISEASAKLGLDAYVIGGFVRDYLLAEKPPKDIDIVAVGSGIALAKQVAQILGGKPDVKVFKNFGTAMVRHGDIELEFVGARKESYSRESRKPVVENGSLEDDQKRRDFTINTLAFSLRKSDYGDLSDPFGGLADLDAGIIRTPLDPTITYSDDPLRMLRAVRFATQLDFEIELASLQAITDNKERIKIVSSERIVDELHKIIACDKPSIGFGLLYKTELLPYILPELSALEGIEEIEGQKHKDNFWHTLEVLDNIAKTTENLWLRWAALLHDIGKAPTKRFDKKIGWTFHAHEFVGSKMVYKLFKRLRLPLNDRMKFVQKMVLLSSRPIILSKDFVTDSAVRRLVFDAGEHIDDLMTLCEADITTKNPGRQKKYLNNFGLVRQKITEVEERDRIRNFQPPISGETIMKTFDVSPSKEIGLIKEAIKEAILDGVIPNEYEPAFAYMLEQGKKMGLKPTKNS